MEEDNHLEVWAGVEPTVNRVGDVYFDQLELNGHCRRIEDLDLFAGLGIKAIRYPVLWERVAPVGLENAEWSWTDARLERLRALYIRPIVGLLHHGSGPLDTSLIDPEFPAKLAAYARAVARRYPWVDAYTPVNEPLTTARFSGLYGHWYPHGHSDGEFALALVNQVRGIQLAMQAIREVNPAAQLIQTEDLGKSYCTPGLEYQADYENTRRWLSLDLLVGRVTPAHSLWGYLEWAGIPVELLEQMAADASPPDIVGVNYYVTGERFLDGRLDHYPPHLHGGNGFDSYADVEAVRVCPEGPAGIGSLLHEAGERFGLPLAVTEVHLGGTREEQLRWWAEVWRETHLVRGSGVDVRAVTAWALLGSYNWHCLVTRNDNHYESGVYDLRSPQPRPTVLAQAIRAAAQGEAFDHPVLDIPGWWRRPERIVYPPASRRDEAAYQAAAQASQDTAAAWSVSTVTTQDRSAPASVFGKTAGRATPPRRILITGGSGTLGQAFARVCEWRALEHMLLTRREMDITDPQQIQHVLETLRPWAVINAAGYVRVDDAEREPQKCMQVNAGASAQLAQACARLSIRLVTFSSDLVFNGEASSPYVESSPVAPLNVYGMSKADGERAIQTIDSTALIVRTSAFFGPWDRYNFATQALQALASGRNFPAVGDVYVSPTYVPDLVQSTLDLLIDGETGLWHLANPGEITWFDFASEVAAAAGADAGQVEFRHLHEMDLLACRPRYSALGSERGLLLPGLDDAIGRFVEVIR